MNKEPLIIVDDVVVDMVYALRSPAGREIGRSVSPIAFMQGRGQVLPGSGNALYGGMIAGQEKEIFVAPADDHDRYDEHKLHSLFGTFVDITDYKRTQEESKEGQSRLAGIIASAMDAIISVDEAQHIVLFNAAAEQMFGCPAASVIGQPLDHFIPERFRTRHRQHIQRFGQTGKTSRKMGHLETLYALRADGQEFPVEASISQAKTGGKTLYTVILRDITERKQTEEALAELQNILTATESIAKIGRWKWDLDTRKVTWSDEMFNLFGVDRENFDGDLDRVINMRIHANDIEAVTQANLAVLEEHNPEPLEYRIVLPDGTERIVWAEGRLTYDRSGHPTALVGYVQDITKRKQAENAWRESQTQLQHVINTVPEGVLLLAPDDSIHLTNPIADEYLAILAPEIDNGRLTHLGDRPLNELLTSSPKGLWHDIVTDERAFEAIAWPVENSLENTGWVLVLRDVTQERNIQQRVQQQGRLAAVGQLAAGIAHDFNNILAVITLYTQLISRTVKMPARAQGNLHIIEKQALRATDLIQQILDFSHQSVLDRQPLDLLPFMKELVKLLNRTLPEHIQIELIYTGEAYFVHADSSRVQQMMMNLVVNARDAMLEGGQLQISLAHVQAGKDTPPPMSEMPAGNWIQIQVVDSGSGIPPEVRPQIFEPFFTTKEAGKGTGLGLAQVFGIVKQHEGYIDVKTELGKGTTFCLYFPALDTEESIAMRPDRASLQLGRGQVLLLVEDDLATREALVDSLTYLNYKVIEAENGREALAILESRVDDFDLVLSDVVMPEMGGVALLHAMRRQNLTIPIILITGHPLGDEMENLQQLGLAGWLPKPPSLENLSDLLVQALAVSPG